MEWETSKENFQPLKQGRHPAQLKPVKPLGSNTVEEQRRAYWKEIANYSGSDPLEAWLRYEVPEVHQVDTRHLQEWRSPSRTEATAGAVYKGAPSTLSIQNRPEIFAVMDPKHDIGQEFALFYIAYAAFLELRRNFSKAEAIFKAGLDRLAHPVDKLRAKYETFQDRMAKRASREGGGEDLAVPAAESGQRSALSCIQGNTAAGSSGPSAQAPNKENGTGMSIFVDDEFEGENASSRHQQAVAPWPSLGSYDQARKENVQKAGKWAGATMAQRPAAMPVVPAKLSIPVDDELKVAGKATRKQALPQGTLRNRLDDPDLDEHLEQDPLRLHKNEKLAEATSKVQDKPPRPPVKPSTTAATSSASTHSQASGLAFDLAKLSGPDGEEVSFEEVRAAAWTQANPNGMPFSTDDMDICSPSPEAQVADQPGSDSQQARAPFMPLPEDGEFDGNATTSLQDAFNAVNTMFSGQMPAQCAPDSIADENAAPAPTQDENQPWAADGHIQQMPPPIAASQEREVKRAMGPDAAGQLLQAAMGGDVTVATRGAFDAINNMFHGALDSQAPWHEQDLSAEQTGAITAALQKAAVDPTVTLSTKEAFQALGAAFGGRLSSEPTRTFRRDSTAKPGKGLQPHAGQPGKPSAGPSAGTGLESTGPMAIWEDTQFLSQQPGHAGDATAGFAVHEDTALFGQRDAAPREQTEGGLLCYEDTEFATDGGFGSREVLQAAGSSPGSGSDCFTAAAEADWLDSAVYEDTDLL